MAGLGGSSMASITGGLGASYAQSYNTALAQNQGMYKDIMAGYQDTMARQTTAQDAIKTGYSGLYNSVLGQMAGQGQAQRTQIDADYAAGTGRMTQSMINRGLGNSTVLDSAARGLEFDRARAGNDLSERLGRMNSDYMSRIGLSSLDYQNAAAQQNTNLDQNRLGFMNSVTAKYPDANMYMRMAEMQGASAEAERDRSLVRGGGAGNPPPSGTLSGTYGSAPRGADYAPGVSSPAYGYGVGGGGIGLGAGAANPVGNQSLPMERRDYSPGSYGDMYTDTPSYWGAAYNAAASGLDMQGGGANPYQQQYDLQQATYGGWGGGGEF